MRRLSKSCWIVPVHVRRNMCKTAIETLWWDCLVCVRACVPWLTLGSSSVRKGFAVSSPQAHCSAFLDMTEKCLIRVKAGGGKRRESQDEREENRRGGNKRRRKIWKHCHDEEWVIFMCGRIATSSVLNPQTVIKYCMFCRISLLLTLNQGSIDNDDHAIDEVTWPKIPPFLYYDHDKDLLGLFVC